MACPTARHVALARACCHVDAAGRKAGMLAPRRDAPGASGSAGARRPRPVVYVFALLSAFAIVSTAWNAAELLPASIERCARRRLRPSPNHAAR